MLWEACDFRITCSIRMDWICKKAIPWKPITWQGHDQAFMRHTSIREHEVTSGNIDLLVRFLWSCIARCQARAIAADAAVSVILIWRGIGFMNNWIQIRSRSASSTRPVPVTPTPGRLSFCCPGLKVWRVRQEIDDNFLLLFLLLSHGEKRYTDSLLHIRMIVTSFSSRVCIPGSTDWQSNEKERQNRRRTKESNACQQQFDSLPAFTSACETLYPPDGWQMLHSKSTASDTHETTAR